ncbi:winged helix-turn-helix transcriptional regulator [Nocardiopsis sp. NPDC006139]|uniref:winged helix-turn-helix transcriptional regulator n=1 Tax=unclassified Nocardiopsis TaxID=2649073 RepID=UPI0033A28685
MPGKRSYGEGCPIAHSLDLVGERWALLVVRELRLGARRYSDLQEALPAIAPTVLSQRLKDLEAVGVLRRREPEPPAAGRVYELTEWGAELEPVFRALARWGVRSPVVPLSGQVSADSVMLGLRTFFAPPEGHEPWSARYDVLLGRERYRIGVERGRLAHLARGRDPEGADVVVRTTKETWRRVLAREEPVAGAVAAGRLEVEGDPGLLERLVAAAAPPPSAG